MTHAADLRAAHLRKLIRVMDGSEFAADDFPTLDDAQEAGRELDALLAVVRAAQALTRDAPSFDDEGSEWGNLVRALAAFEAGA